MSERGPKPPEQLPINLLLQEVRKEQFALFHELNELLQFLERLQKEATETPQPTESSERASIEQYLHAMNETTHRIKAFRQQLNDLTEFQEDLRKIHKQGTSEVAEA